MSRKVILGYALALSFVILSAARDVTLKTAQAVETTFRSLSGHVTLLICFSATASLAILWSRVVREPSTSPYRRETWRDLLLLNVTTALGWITFFHGLASIQLLIFSSILIGFMPISLLIIRRVSDRMVLTRRHLIGSAIILVGVCLVSVDTLRAALNERSLLCFAGAVIVSVVASWFAAANNVLSARLNAKGVKAPAVFGSRFWLLLFIALVWTLFDPPSTAAMEGWVVWTVPISVGLLGIAAPIMCLQTSIDKIGATIVTFLIASHPIAVLILQLALKPIFSLNGPLDWVIILGAVFVTGAVILGGTRMWPFDGSQRLDLEPTRLEDLSWDTAQAARSLQTVFVHAVKQATDAIGWYLKAKNPKKLWARLLRVLAILAAGIAGIIPMLAQMWLDENGSPRIAPAWASVCLGAAAVMVALDHFFGFSTAWMRYLSTELDIRKLLDEFQIDWEIERVNWTTGQPTQEQTLRGLAKCKAFLTQVDTMIQQETNTWIAEFQTTLRLIDEASKTKVEIAALGGANVVVANGEECDAGWTLSIDEGNPEQHAGKTAAFRDMLAGVHTFKAKGAIQGKPRQAEVSVSVPRSGIANVDMMLK
jgi:drug/metabolite transporter (DMT)-like permease